MIGYIINYILVAGWETAGSRENVKDIHVKFSLSPNTIRNYKTWIMERIQTTCIPYFNNNYNLTHCSHYHLDESFLFEEILVGVVAKNSKTFITLN